MTERFRANMPRFVDETVDDESLIMDMVKGTYYSCVGASALAWNELKSGASATEVADVLTAVYSVHRDTAFTDIGRFVAALLDEEVLVPDADAAAAPGRSSDVSKAPEGYVTLGFERFTDLADLILLDPVHDVADAGWPHVAE
jgi:hypothetical protein